MTKCFDAYSDTPLKVDLRTLEWDEWDREDAAGAEAAHSERAEPRVALEAVAALLVCLPAVPRLVVLGRGALIAVLLGAGLTPLARREHIAPMLHLALACALVCALLGASQAAVSGTLHVPLAVVRLQRASRTRAYADGGLCALAVAAALAAWLTVHAQVRLAADVAFVLLVCVTLARR
jgi:hypothetical protein